MISDELIYIYPAAYSPEILAERLWGEFKTKENPILRISGQFQSLTSQVPLLSIPFSFFRFYETLDMYDVYQLVQMKEGKVIDCDIVLYISTISTISTIYCIVYIFYMSIYTGPSDVYGAQPTTQERVLWTGKLEWIILD